MEIEKSNLIGGNPGIKFHDADNHGCEAHVQSKNKVPILQFNFQVRPGVVDWLEFSQEDIKTLLPYLQAFAETGQLEPTQGKSLSVDFVKSVIKMHIDHYENEKDQEGFDTCEAILRDLGLPEAKYAHAQGEEAFLDVSNELATMQESGVAMAANIVEQGNRIQELEQLVKEWRKLLEDRDSVSTASEHHVWEECESELREKTSQLLGE